jgi:proteasome assembly chaperone (PAC2) family protein
MGEVAFRAATYLVENLKGEELAQILPGEFFYLTGSTIREGVLSVPELPQGKFYYWKNKAGRNDLIIFLSSAQPDLARAQGYSERIIQLAKYFGAQTVIGFASLPQPIDHTQEPAVWFASTSAEIKNTFKKYRLNELKQGQISGMNGLFLGLAAKAGLEGLCLLAEIPLYTIQIENPRASYAVLNAFIKMLDIQLDLSGLLGQAQSMEQEINKLFDFLKLGAPGQAGPIGEEEIEKIKKTLSQLTKLPASVKEKIENLFAEAKSDIKKAGQIKAELDKWNVYKEYEDRFLDLFKQKKEKDN